MGKKVFFDFYGIRLTFNSEDEELATHIERDFRYFISQEHRDIHITITAIKQTPPYDKIPELKGRVFSPLSVCYDDKDTRYIDYNGRALAVYDYHEESGQLYSLEADLLHEIAYLMILSRSGELLDKRGIHRIHALGISIDGRGLLCLLPTAGGKTTLALELLKHPEVTLLSDDTPLISREGQLLPFPLRMGVERGISLDIPERYTREFRRREYPAKTLIDIDYFKDKIAKTSPAHFILIGEREFSMKPRLQTMNKAKAVPAFIWTAIVGVGLPQLVEYFVRLTAGDIFSKIKIVLSRALACLRIMRRAKVYRFVVSRDTRLNAKVLIDFFEMSDRTAH